MGYLYVIRAINTGYYKIGITSRSVADRLKQLQTGNHNKLEVVRSYDFSNPGKVEQELHNHFAERRINGEWFNLPSARSVDDALDQLNHYHYNEIEGHLLRQTGTQSGSPRFDFSLSILANKELGVIGQLIMFAWSLFIPLIPVIDKVENEDDNQWWIAPTFEDDDSEEIRYKVLE